MMDGDTRLTNSTITLVYDISRVSSTGKRGEIASTFAPRDYQCTFSSNLLIF